MSRTLKISLISLALGVLGIFVGFASGAVGICGNGGWGLIFVYLGLAGLAMFVVSLPVMLGQVVYRKWYRPSS